jgi:hypothetical protein
MKYSRSFTLFGPDGYNQSCTFFVEGVFYFRHRSFVHRLQSANMFSDVVHLHQMSQVANDAHVPHSNH